MQSKIDQYLRSTQQWRQEIEMLRELIINCGLEETIKWNAPCYTIEGKNVVIIQSFKEYCALLFFKGVMMTDPYRILEKTGENTRVGRQVRFHSIKDVQNKKTALTEYIKTAIDIEKSGKKIDLTKLPFTAIPDEFKDTLDKMPNLKKAFDALTPGRKRAYLLHFSAPKLSKTRESRIAKSIPNILKGKGLND